MSRFWSGIRFGAIVVLAVYGMHRYVWARLVRDTRLPRAARIGGTIAIVLLACLMPLALVIGRKALGGAASAFALAVYSWLGLLFYLVLVLAAVDLARAVSWLVRRVARRSTKRVDVQPSRASDAELATHSTATLPSESARTESLAGRDEPQRFERRVFLARATAGTALLGSGAIAAVGYHSATGDILTPEIPIRLARLPRELSGYRIVQLSDLHLGSLLRRGFLEAVVEKANALRPDLVVITGDLVDAPVSILGPELAPLAKLRARHGVVFVTGNHEYYSGADEWVEFLRGRGIRVLMNERVAIGDSVAPEMALQGDAQVESARDGVRRGPSFDLAGIPDVNAGSHFAEHAPSLARALAGRDPERELVLLAHQPSQIAMADGKGVGLQLSGHTHGGQMWPFGALVGLVQPYVAGHHVHRDGTQIYVSRGTGFWGPPMRIANPAEIASIVLVAG
jgi:predicted MPP superfamily phosphohydrolase